MSETSSVVVKEVCDRNKLSEGRNSGMAFAFCKLMENGEYHTVQPFSPCKDYLNDVIYTEQTGKDFNACGLHTTKKNIFEFAQGYLAIQILPPKGNPAWGDLNRLREQLRTNYKSIQTLLNYVEETFEKHGCTERSVITETADPDIFLLSVPLWWCRSTHLISLYSLICRLAYYWNGTGEPLTFLETFKSPVDVNLWTPSYGAGGLAKYKCMLEFGIRLTTPQELDYMATINKGQPNIHGNGILCY